MKQKVSKIGIITFHNAQNYGAVLQTYALQEILKSLANDIAVINHFNRNIHDQYRFSFWESTASLTSILGKVKRMIGNLYRFYSMPFKIITKEHFKKFLQSRLSLIDEDKINTLDILIFGSDQIWNGDITGNDLFYVCGNDKAKKCKKISYAASAGWYEERFFDNERFINGISNLDSISVREVSLQKRLKSKLNITSQVVIDPTLLCDENVFKRIANSKTDYNKYILVYRIIPCKKVTSIASKLANSLNAKRIEIRYASLLNFFDSSIRSFATPEDFLGYIQNAECIVTTSFHGVAFSIVFRKPFYFISTGNKAENRITSLLDQLGLSDRIIPETQIPEFKPIDYKSPQPDGTSIEQKLFRLREFSRNWLINALTRCNA